MKLGLSMNSICAALPIILSKAFFIFGKNTVLLIIVYGGDSRIESTI